MPDHATIEETDGSVSAETGDFAGRPAPPSFEIGSLIVGDTAVLRLRGDFDYCTASKFQAVASPVFEQGARNVVIDCSDLTFLDSGGLRALVALERQTHQHCGILTMRHCSDIVCRVIEVTALTTVLGVETPPAI